MTTTTATLRCPVRKVGDAHWMSISHMGIGRIDVVAYKYQLVNENYSFAGGHRVRHLRFWDNIHLHVPAGIELNIEDVAEKEIPAKRRHNKGK